MTDSSFNSLVDALINKPLRLSRAGSYDIVGYFKRMEGALTPLIREIVVYRSPACEIIKAEDILTYLKAPANYIVKCKEEEYFTQDGSLFKDVLNPKKRKLIFLNQQLDNAFSRERFLLFDKDILLQPEEPMHRFILRKLIPSLPKHFINFGFADLSMYLLQPSPPVKPNAFDDIREDIAQMCNEYIVAV